jgi:DNA-binding winged helix-turn-helix (wHTH) protein
MAMTMTAQSITDLDCDRFSIDVSDERLFGPHGPIRLGNKAFQVLLRLVERRGRLVTKDELMSSVWDGTIVSEFSLTSAIKELRRALDDDARAPRFIESVYGRGYRFLRPIEIIDRTPAVEIDSPATAWPDLPRDCERGAAPVDVPAIPAVGDRLIVATEGRRGSGASPLRRSYKLILGLVAVVTSLTPALTFAYANRAPQGATPALAVETPRCHSG